MAAGNDTQGFSAPYALDDGAWHQIVVTYNSTTNTITLYVDGSPVSQTDSFSGALDTQPSLFGLGEHSGGITGDNAQSSEDYNLDDVSIYSSALSAAQVSPITEHRATPRPWARPARRNRAKNAPQQAHNGER